MKNSLIKHIFMKGKTGDQRWHIYAIRPLYGLYAAYTRPIVYVHGSPKMLTGIV